jgi:hypothetical protein
MTLIAQRSRQYPRHLTLQQEHMLPMDQFIDDAPRRVPQDAPRLGQRGGQAKLLTAPYRAV